MTHISPSPGSCKVWYVYSVNVKSNIIYCKHNIKNTKSGNGRHVRIPETVENYARPSIDHDNMGLDIKMSKGGLQIEIQDK